MIEVQFNSNGGPLSVWMNCDDYVVAGYYLTLRSKNEPNLVFDYSCKTQDSKQEHCLLPIPVANNDNREIKLVVEFERKAGNDNTDYTIIMSIIQDNVVLGTTKTSGKLDGTEQNETLFMNLKRMD